MPQNYRALPKLRDSIPFLYLERGRLTQTKNGLEYENALGRYAVPVATLGALLLGPGTSVTHRAVVTCARAGCSLLFVGEDGVRFYAGGHGETRKAYALQRQAEAHADPEKRLRVVERMYRLRFADPLPPGVTIEQVRGHEGARVKQAYRRTAERFGVPWRGRNYDLGDWDAADPANRALSAASACLVGVCHAAVFSAGYSPGLGFVHQGLHLAFVFDVADLYKTDLAVPIAFATAAEALDAQRRGDPFNLESTVRKRCRNAFRNFRLLDRILPDIRAVLDLEPNAPLPDGFDPDDAYGLPTAWWEPPVEPRFAFGNAAGDGAPLDDAYGERDPDPPDPLGDWMPDGPASDA